MRISDGSSDVCSSDLKPAANFHNALVDGVLRWLEARTEWLAPDRLSRDALNVPEAQGSLRIGPPPTVRNEPSPIDPAFMAAIGRKYDVAERDARNRARGKAGEEIGREHVRTPVTNEHLVWPP